MYAESKMLKVVKRYKMRLTFSPTITTRVPYANSLDLDETLGVSPRSKRFDSQTTFSLTLSDIEALWKLKQTRNVADDNLFGRLRVKGTTFTCHRIDWPSARGSHIELGHYGYTHHNFSTTTDRDFIGHESSIWESILDIGIIIIPTWSL